PIVKQINPHRNALRVMEPTSEPFMVDERYTFDHRACWHGRLVTFVMNTALMCRWSGDFTPALLQFGIARCDRERWDRLEREPFASAVVVPCDLLIDAMMLLWIVDSTRF